MGWETARFGDVCEFVRGPFGGALKKNIFKEDGYAVYEQQHAIYDQFENIRYFVSEDKFLEMVRFELYPGDLIMSCSGTMGKIAIVPTGIKQGIINQALLKLTPGKKLSPEFLKLWMESRNFQEQVESLSQGAAIKNMASVKILKEIMVPTPSEAEQKCIVAILEQAFADIGLARAKTEQNLNNARELFESYLQQVFSPSGEGWEYKSLKDVLLDKPRNGWSPPAKNHADIGVPVLTLSSVTGFDFKSEKVKFTSAPTKADSHYWVDNGDLLITRSNTPELVGHVAICAGIKTPTIYPDLIMKLKLDVSVVVTQFIYYQLRSKNLRKLITSSAQGANPTMKKINQGIVQDLPIGYPDKEIQKTIVDRLDSVYCASCKLQNIYQEKLLQLEALNKSILQKAFSGELTNSKRDVA